MEKLKNRMGFFSAKRIFYFPELDTKKVCLLGLLMAITAVLSIVSGYLRIGESIKFNVSFVAVFVISYAFGGIMGGVAGAFADVISAISMGSVFLPITALEFVYGFMFGVLFFGLKGRGFAIRTAVYDVIHILMNLFLKTWVLAFFYGGAFGGWFIMRLPACLVQAGIIFAVLILIRPFIESFVTKQVRK